MTSWTEEADVSTSYNGNSGGYNLTTEGGVYLTTEGGVYLTREGVTTDFTEEADSSDRYIPFGVGLKIATEAFDWILTEGTGILLVHSRTPWTEETDVTTTYTEVEDV